MDPILFSLTGILEQERNKARREESLNLLEGYLYRLRDLLEGDATSPFHEFVQPEEHARLARGLQDTLTWLHEEGQTADASTLKHMRDKLEYVGMSAL